MTRRKIKINLPKSTAQQLGNIVKSSREIMRKDKGLSGDLDRLPMLTWIMFLKFLDDMEHVREQEAKLAGKKFRLAIEPPYRWKDWGSKADGMTGPELLAFINQEEAVRPDGTKGAGLFAYLRSLQSSNGDRRDIIAKVFEGTVNRMINGYLLRDVINKVNDIHFTSQDEIHTLGHLYETMLSEMRDAAGDSGEFYTPRSVVKFMVTVVDPKLGETVLDPASGTGGFLVEAFEHLKKQAQKAEDFTLLQNGTLFGCEPKPLPYLLCQMNLLLHGVEYPEIDPHNALRFPLREIGDRDRVNIIVTNPPFGGEEEQGVLSNFPEDKRTAETALLFLQLIMRKIKRNLGSKPGRAAVVVPESVMSDGGVAQRTRQDLITSYNLHTVVRLPKGVFEPYSDIQTNLLFFDTSGQTRGVWFYQHEVPAERQQMRNPCYTQSAPLKFEELIPVISWWKSRETNDRAWYVPLTEIANRSFSLDFRNPNAKINDAGHPLSAATELQLALTSANQDVASALPKIKSIELKAGEGIRRIPLSSFLEKVKEEANVVPDNEYQQVTVKLYGKGVIRRGILRGRDIKTRPQFTAKAGHLLMSRIDARNGAFGVIPPALDGALITNDFPMFRVNSDVIIPEFLTLIMNSSAFVGACKRSSKGTTNRKRLREELFLMEEIQVPPIEMQKTAVELAGDLRSLRAKLSTATKIGEAFDSMLADFMSRDIAELRDEMNSKAAASD